MWDFFDTQPWVIAFTAFGTIILWLKENATHAKSGEVPRALRVFALTGLIDRLKLSNEARWWIQFAIFVVLGTLVGIAFVKPMTVIQGASAGMGWTAAFSQHRQTRH